MNILDFEELDNSAFNYRTVQKVWGDETEINVAFENEVAFDPPKERDINLRGVIRPLWEKLKFVEENRSAINEAIVAANLKVFSADDLKKIELCWALLVYFSDTGNCELTLYLNSAPDLFDDEDIAVTICVDGSLTVEDLEL